MQNIRIKCFCCLCKIKKMSLADLVNRITLNIDSWYFISYYISIYYNKVRRRIFTLVRTYCNVSKRNFYFELFNKLKVFLNSSLKIFVCFTSFTNKTKTTTNDLFINIKLSKLHVKILWKILIFKYIILEWENTLSIIEI